MSKKLDRRNYMRNTLLALSAKDKPFIIRGFYVAKPNLNYVTYTDIRPYVPQGASTNQICNHINITAKQVERYIDFFTYAEGRYAYYCENPWVNGHKVRPSKPHIERRKVQYQEPEDISPELFMDMFA